MSDFIQINTANLTTGSMKPSRLFAVTITFVNFAKLHVFQSLEEFCIRILVAEENHYNNEVHHHIYMRTKEKHRIFEIYDMINRVYDLPDINHTTANANIDYSDEINGVLVQTVRNERTYLKYITKEDCNPIYKGINQSHLSFFYSTLKWAEHTESFNYLDPHVLNHPQYYKLLEKVHKTCQQKKRIDNVLPLVPIYRPLEEYQQNTWHENVIDWWNDWMINGYRHKKRQLFLWGGSNTGKTTFIQNIVFHSFFAAQKSSQLASIDLHNDNHHSQAASSSFFQNLAEQERNDHSLIINDNQIEEQLNADSLSEAEEMNQRQVFSPTPNEKRFAWQDFDSKLHKLVIIDEFDIGEYNITELKKALAGEKLIANRKNDSSLPINIRCPFIIISNLPPPSNDFSTQMQGVLERLRVIRADRLIKA